MNNNTESERASCSIGSSFFAHLPASETERTKMLASVFWVNVNGLSWWSLENDEAKREEKMEMKACYVMERDDWKRLSKETFFFYHFFFSMDEAKTEKRLMTSKKHKQKHQKVIICLIFFAAH